jgi:mannitol 2-dehydrogenase
MTALSDPSFDSAYTGPAHVPAYDRSAVTAGIVHLGVGAFHRAHQAYYADQLLELGEDPGWGIAGIGVKAVDAAVRDALVPQRGRYTLLMKDSSSARARVVGSIVDYRLAPDDVEAAIEQIAAPSTRIVSLTVTEGGYYNDPNTGEFMAGDPDIAHDVANPSEPVTHFGLVTEALRRRRSRNVPPPTLLTCDNIQGNGHVYQAAMANFATLQDPELADWIAANVVFPNTMVDRITPRTTDANRAEVARDFGIEDAWPIVSETFIQWVVEDRFPTGRPAWEKAGVQMVDDVFPYELLKLRILNATHQLLAYLGYLSGYTYVDQAASDPTFVALQRRYMKREGFPTLRPVPGTDVAAYGEQIIERFSNTQIQDTIARLCTESSTYVSTFVFPVLRDNLAAGGEIDVLTLVVAAWARYLEGTDEHGQPIDVIERRWDDLHARALAHRTDPRAFLAGNVLFGDLADNPRFVDAFVAASQSVHAKGARGAMLDLLARP